MVMTFFALVISLTAGAQVSTVLKPLQLGAALGAAIPLNDLANNFDTGFNLTGTVGVNPVGLPVGFRADAAYNQFGSKGLANVKAKVADVSGNVVVRTAGLGITPYAIGGVGVYHVSSSVSGGAASNHFGFNVGAGVDVPLSGLIAFIEARYNSISENGPATSYVPITVGLMF